MIPGNTAIVVGSGICGLATALALAKRGYKVTVMDRTERPVGASIRNFGMIWPIGQPAGDLYRRAILSRSIWKRVCSEAGIWYEEAGSLHLAYSEDEWLVLQELEEIYKERSYRLLDARETESISPAVITQGLKGSIYSTEELIVDPREALNRIPRFLAEKYGVCFLWNKAATDIRYSSVYCGKESFQADLIYVCSGADFEVLYPELFSGLPIIKCKLQMLRLAEQPDQWRIGPALCGGLSLIHYGSFKAATSLQALRERYEQEYPEYLKWDIHVMASQHEKGELTIGDSHEYGNTHDPFDKKIINDLIIAYLNTFAKFRDQRIIETWNGIYPKMTNGDTQIVLEPEKGVTIINGLGGAGMTLSFGLCEEIIQKLDAQG